MHKAQALSPGSCGARVGSLPRSETLAAGGLECWAPTPGCVPLPYAQTAVPLLFTPKTPLSAALLLPSHGFGGSFLYFPPFTPRSPLTFPWCTLLPSFLVRSNFSNFSSELPAGMFTANGPCLGPDT